MNTILLTVLQIFMVLAACGATKKKHEDSSGVLEIKKLDEHVVAMAKFLDKNPKSYRLHIRTDLDGARIYRQVGRYVIVYPTGEVTYVPDRD